MSLNWQWKNKIGEARIKNSYTDEILNVNIYEGNAPFIFIAENKTDDTYYLVSFFNDLQHVKNMIKDNCFNDWIEITITKKITKNSLNIILKLADIGIRITLDYNPF